MRAFFGKVSDISDILTGSEDYSFLNALLAVVFFRDPMSTREEDRDWFGHVRASFRKQGIMRLLGARLSRLEKGLVEISTRTRPRLSQQDGFVHAGAMASLADSAGGYATLSLLPPGSRVLSVEFKLNFTRPAIGDMIRGQGRVRKLGRTIAVCELEVYIREGKIWSSCAWGSQTSLLYQRQVEYGKVTLNDLRI